MIQDRCNGVFQLVLSTIRLSIRLTESGVRDGKNSNKSSKPPTWRSKRRFTSVKKTFFLTSIDIMQDKERVVSETWSLDSDPHSYTVRRDTHYEHKIFESRSTPRRQTLGQQRGENRTLVVEYQVFSHQYRGHQSPRRGFNVGDKVLFSDSSFSLGGGSWTLNRSRWSLIPVLLLRLSYEGGSSLGRNTHDPTRPWTQEPTSSDLTS